MEDNVHTRVGWHRVQPYRVLLVVAFLVNAAITINAQTEAEKYIQQKETEVKLIATSAAENADLCDYIKTCQQAGYCSTAACFQTRSDVAESTCVGVTNNVGCSCNIQARTDYTKSYVRVPGLGNRPAITEESVAAICIQQHLDSTFLSRLNPYVYEYDYKYYSFYLGTIDGAYRYFPGTAIEDCNDYDPRVRPWYIGAISVVKDLVVLVDAASSMSSLKEFADGDNRNQTTALAIALNMTKQLLDTLTQGDRATVMAYYSQALLSFNASYTAIPPVDGSTLNLTADSQFLELVTEVSNVGSVDTSDSSNATAAILQALQVLGDAGSPAGALKVIVVLTDGQSPLPPEQPGLDDLARQLNTSYSTLFVYQIDGNDVGLAAFASKLLRGRNEKVNVNPSTVLNPLYALKSYFSFLANARMSSGYDSYFWQPPYLDYDFLGLVRTVAYPVMSSAGNLLGVAAIDIQISKIDPTIAPEVEYIVNTTKVTYPPTIAPTQIPTLGAISDANDGSTACNASSLGTTSTDAICQEKENDPRVPFLEGLCCSQSGCLDQHERIKLTALWICLGLVGVLAMVVGILFALWKKKQSTTKTVQRELSDYPKGGLL